MPRHYAIFVVSRIRPKNVKAGGSRELPSVWLLSGLVKIDLPCERLSLYKNRAGTIPGSRLLPPRFGHTNDRNNEARSSQACQSGSPPKGADRNGLATCRAAGLAKAQARQRSRGALNYSTLSLNCSLVDALERPSLLAESFKENWN